MALIKSTFTPGIDKQTSTYGAEGKWVDSKNVRLWFKNVGFRFLILGFSVEDLHFRV